MATKPSPGGSDGTWGTELNAYLEVSLAADGKVLDGAVFSTSAAPTVDAGVANKKYVDDQITASSDPAYSGGESHTFDGGLILKTGIQAVGNSVTFADAFPNAIVSVNITIAENFTGQTYAVHTVTVNGFTRVGSSKDFYWTAIGY
ncbi:hypothetical protein LCGC14_2009320 [marine sediment metagenome]|uniref:Putative tail fiber protein gp53-like C-terminal domain-containing protein n=1 Tax=marine sediment metagenome TaxID=412755 RepID=A0A0F9F0S6_9ZZZZ